MNKFEHMILKPTYLKGLLFLQLILYYNQNFMTLDVYKRGISDHHQKIFSVLSKKFAKGKPTTAFYCCYQNFDQNSVSEAFKKKISQLNVSLEEFLEIFQSMSDAFAPCKIRRNNSFFKRKTPRTEIIIKSKLCNKFNKSRTSVN